MGAGLRLCVSVALLPLRHVRSGGVVQGLARNVGAPRAPAPRGAGQGLQPEPVRAQRHALAGRRRAEPQAVRAHLVGGVPVAVVSRGH